MDLASGFSDTYNPFPGGYSPQQNAAFNATMSNAAANQAAITQQSQAYDPFASTGGFGRQTADYSAAGAAYGRAVPGEIYGHPGAGYTPATQSQVDSYGPSAQSYADQHHERYGYYPTNDYFSQHYEPFNSYGQPGVGGGGFGDPFTAQPTTPAPGNIPSWATLTPDQGNYVQQHVARYGYEPASDFFVPGGGWDQNYGSQSRSTGTTPSGPGGADFNSYGSKGSGGSDTLAGGSGRDALANYIRTPEQENYDAQHVATYGYGQANDFYAPGGGWDKYYGPNGSLGQNSDDRNLMTAFGDDSPYGQPTGVGGSGYGDGYGGYGKAWESPFPDPPGANIADPKSYWASNDQPNSWEASRAPYTKELANDPARMYDMAVRLYLELNGDPVGRQAIAEAMFNKNAARQLDPLSKGYFPKGPEYAAKYAKETRDLKNNPELLGKIYGEIGRAAAGSNLSQGATDWASGKTADESAQYTTEVWKSPNEGERFFRKDIINDHTGRDAARQIQEWYRNMQSLQPQWPGS